MGDKKGRDRIFVQGITNGFDAESEFDHGVELNLNSSVEKRPGDYNLKELQIAGKSFLNANGKGMRPGDMNDTKRSDMTSMFFGGVGEMDATMQSKANVANTKEVVFFPSMWKFQFSRIIIEFLAPKD